MKQRLRLANASPQLLKAYEDDEIDLDQLMAFCLIEDHKRQEEVFAAIQSHWNKDARAIRRLLTEKTVRADDARAVFIGADVYEAADGIILRDLFDEDDGGYWQNVPLLEKLVREKLDAAAAAVKAEGWGWVEAAVDFPWNHQRNYRALKPIAPALSEDGQEQFEALSNEYEELDGVDEEERDEALARHLAEIRAQLMAFENKSPVFDPAAMRKAGVFVSLTEDGFLHIDRGYVRREDEAATVRTQHSDRAPPADEEHGHRPNEGDSTPPVPQDDDGAALPDRLMVELTAYRSLALREAVAHDHTQAYLAVLHVLTLQLFYHYPHRSCLQISAKDLLVPPFPGLAEFSAAKAIEVRHQSWQRTLPESEDELWAFLSVLDQDRREALFAHCAGLTINAVHEPHARVSPRLRHGDQLAATLALDMVKAGWTASAENYFNRVTKTQIIAAVCEARGEKTAELIADLKKKDMTMEAERLIAETGWLPECLRTPEPLDAGAEASLSAFLEAEEAEAA